MDENKMTKGSIDALLAAILLTMVFAANLAVANTPLRAGDYPDHPVRFINGFAPGGPVDTVARIMAQNRPGAGRQGVAHEIEGEVPYFAYLPVSCRVMSG
jgi:hypothetical protein